MATLDGLAKAVVSDYLTIACRLQQLLLSHLQGSRRHVEKNTGLGERAKGSEKLSQTSINGKEFCEARQM
jgi:hypothetical protein